MVTCLGMIFTGQITLSDGGDLEAQVNTAELTEAPDQSSEEPKAVLASDYREGKPRT